MTSLRSVDRTIDDLKAFGRRCGSNLDITGLLVGGSIVYQHIEHGTTDQARDWDGVMVVKSKADILELINISEKRSKLLSVVGIDVEEFSGLVCPSPSSPYWELFDGVRVSGHSRDGVKISVRILSEEHFRDPKAHGDNILSFKDRRIYEFASADGSTRWRVQQATRVDKHLAILHDDWAYLGNEELCEHGRDIKPTVFGVTADIVMTGLWVFEEENIGAVLVERLQHHYKRATGNPVQISTFAAHPRFGDWYRDWIKHRLGALGTSKDLCSCHSNTLFVHNKLGLQERCPPERWDSYVARLQPAVEKHLSQGIKPTDVQTTSHDNDRQRYEILSPNSQCQLWKVTSDDEKAASTLIFCKQSVHTTTESVGAEFAAQYYPRVQKPLVISKDKLIYPVFHGRTQAELRYDWLEGRCENSHLVTLIMDAELRKAEDTLRAYAMSIVHSRIVQTPCSLSIHRFFYNRLASPGTRLRDFYGDGLDISDNKISLEMFMDAQIYVNGFGYPALRSICKRAEYLLQPEGEISYSPVAFGLGDAHGGNMMIAPDRNGQGYHDILYIDYETAGFHSLLLDLAKPFYNDVMFSTLFSDIIEDDNSDIQFHMSDGKLEISLALKVDCISKSVLEVKKRHLIEPLRTLLHAKGLSIDTHVPHFVHALFSCALLTRNYQHKLRSLMQSVAVGVVLSQATCWDELWEKCESLFRI
ncbi:hypothetical protein G7Y79_00018g045870 [Physcia stellaris]|nr:hypothetical protein G7Y79_00018g045870 [Physcia stellaris]